MSVNNPVGGVYQDFVSSLDPLLEKFDIYPQLVRRYGDQWAAAYRMMRELSLWDEVAQTEFHHFEDERLQDVLVVSANATAAGPGLPLTFTLDANSYTPQGASYAREQFSVIMPSGYRMAWIQTVTTTTPVQITIVPFDDNLTLSVTAGQELAVGPSAFGEGTNQPASLQSKIFRIDNNTQILKEHFRASGTAMTNEASINMMKYAKDVDTQKAFQAAGLGNTYVVKGASEVDLRMTFQLGYLWYMGERNNNTAQINQNAAAGALDGTVWSTQGVYKGIVAQGNTPTYSVGSMALSDFDSMGNIFDRENVSPLSPILWLNGRNQYVEFENMMLANQAATFVNYTADEANEKIFAKMGKKVNVNFTQVTKGDYTFLPVRENMFTDPRGLGAISYNARNLGIMIPMDEGTDPRTKEKLSHVRMRFKKLGAYNRQFAFWTRGQEITNNDSMEWNSQCDVAVQTFKLNQCLVWQGQ